MSSFVVGCRALVASPCLSLLPSVYSLALVSIRWHVVHSCFAGRPAARFCLLPFSRLRFFFSRRRHTFCLPLPFSRFYIQELIYKTCLRIFFPLLLLHVLASPLAAVLFIPPQRKCCTFHVFGAASFSLVICTWLHSLLPESLRTPLCRFFLSLFFFPSRWRKPTACETSPR